MEEFLNEFLKIHTWIFGVSYWGFIIWMAHREDVKIGVKGVALFGFVFLILVLLILAHAVAGYLLAIGFAFLVYETFKGSGKRG